MSKSVRFFEPGRYYEKNRHEILLEINRVLLAGDLILRGDVDTFEEKLAQYLGREYVVGLASGTDALFLSLRCLNIGIGDEVIVPAYSFRAVVEAVHQTGAKPIIADMGEDWRGYKTSKTAAIIPVHMEGRLLNWKSDDADVHVIEDSCQAIGAGNVGGKVSCYSFYPAKILGCYGDGGAIATDDKRFHDNIRGMRNHYKGVWAKCGWNSRLDNLQAAILNFKLRELGINLSRRREVASVYTDSLPKGFIRPPVRTTYQDYVIQLGSNSEREALFEHFNKNGVETMRNEYPFPAGYKKKPRASHYEATTLRLPCNEVLPDDDVDHVIKVANSFTYD